MNWPLLQNSLLVAGLTTLASTLLGFFSSLWLAGLPPRWRKLFLVFAIIAVALPPFLVTNCWLHLLGLTGIWRSWLSLNILSLGGTIWILILMTWPITLFFVLAAWRKLEQSQLEIDPLLRAGSLIKWLLLPTARAALAQAAAVTFILSLNNFAVPAILQVKVFPAEVWVNFNTTFDYVSALKLSWPMILAPFLLLLVFRERQNVWTSRRNAVSPLQFRRQLGSVWFFLGGLFFFVAVFFSMLPIAQLVFAASTWTSFLPALTAGKSALMHSFGLAALGATLIVLVALTSWRLPAGIILWIPFLIPGVLLGISLIALFNRPPFIAFYQSIGIVVVGFAIRYAAPGWNLVAHSLRTTDRNLTDAARLEGANGWQLFWRVQLPQVFPQLCVAWYVGYLFCLWDVETLVLIVPPGSETISLRIFNLLHYGHNSQVNALCVLLLVLAVLPLVVAVLATTVISIRNPKSEIPKSERRPKSEYRKRSSDSPEKSDSPPSDFRNTFGFRASDFFRISDFGFRILRSNALLAGAIIFLFGCSASETVQKEIHVQSKIFSRVEIIGARGTGLGQFNKPRSLALDKEDNLFVVDMTGRVQKFSSSGIFLASWQMPQTDLGKPKGMCRDSDGNIVVVEPHYSRVNHFSPGRKLISQWGIHGTNGGQLAFPRSVAANSLGEIFVSEYGLTERVQKFSKNGGRFLISFGKPGDGAGEFNRAEGLGIDSKDQIYVADSCNHRIQIFSSGGKFLASYGKAGNGVGELSYPYDVRVDATGLQFVCEFGNSRIQIFDAKNQPLEILGEVGAAPGQFANPWSLDLDSRGNLYVADALNHRVQKFIRLDRVASASGGCGIKGPGARTAMSASLDMEKNLSVRTILDSRGHGYPRSFSFGQYACVAYEQDANIIQRFTHPPEADATRTISHPPEADATRSRQETLANR